MSIPDSIIPNSNLTIEKVTILYDGLYDLLISIWYPPDRVETILRNPTHTALIIESMGYLIQKVIPWNQEKESAELQAWKITTATQPGPNKENLWKTLKEKQASKNKKMTKLEHLNKVDLITYIENNSIFSSTIQDLFNQFSTENPKRPWQQHLSKAITKWNETHSEALIYRYFQIDMGLTSWKQYYDINTRAEVMEFFHIEIPGAKYKKNQLHSSDPTPQQETSQEKWEKPLKIQKTKVSHSPKEERKYLSPTEISNHRGSISQFLQHQIDTMDTSGYARPASWQMQLSNAIRSWDRANPGRSLYPYDLKKEDSTTYAIGGLWKLKYGITSVDDAYKFFGVKIKSSRPQKQQVIKEPTLHPMWEGFDIKFLTKCVEYIDDIFREMMWDEAPKIGALGSFLWVRDHKKEPSVLDISFNNDQRQSRENEGEKWANLVRRDAKEALGKKHHWWYRDSGNQYTFMLNKVRVVLQMPFQHNYKKPKSSWDMPLQVTDSWVESDFWAASIDAVLKVVNGYLSGVYTQMETKDKQKNNANGMSIVNTDRTIPLGRDTFKISRSSWWQTDKKIQDKQIDIYPSTISDIVIDWLRKKEPIQVYMDALWEEGKITYEFQNEGWAKSPTLMFSIDGWKIYIHTQKKQWYIAREP